MSTFEYRAYIDGLRALAVIAVLIFHFDKKLLPGGFVGVDVFFVISGYLITSIVISECKNGQFSFGRFYQRRIARIFPLFFLVVLSTLFAASFLYTPQDFARTGTSAIAAALSVANLKFMLEGNYFQVLPDAKPFLHFWSLSLEEQFYVVYPPIVYFVFQFKKPTRNIRNIIVGIATTSLIACLILTIQNPIWSFYLLPTRAWELLSGCILATYQDPDRKIYNQKLGSILSNIGLIIIIISFFVINEGMSFPGHVAAFPVLGTVLLIGGFQDKQPNNHRNVAKQFLAHSLLIIIGKMSYSLYLWHWPIYCLVDYSLFFHSSIIRSILKISLTILFSLSSYFWFEKPIRSYLNEPKKHLFGFTILVIGIIISTVIGFLISTNNYINANPATVKDGGITFNSELSNPVIVLMGDSHATMYSKTLKEIVQKVQVKAHVISVTGGYPLKYDKLYKDSLLFLESAKPDITIFVAAWAGIIDKNNESEKEFKIALSQIAQRSKHIILITQPPILPKYATRQEIRRFGRRKIFEEVASSSIRQSANAFLLSNRNEKIHVLDINPLFEKLDGELNFTDMQDRQLFFDEEHLSDYGSQLIKSPLSVEISQILALPKTSTRQ